MDSINYGHTSPPAQSTGPIDCHPPVCWDRQLTFLTSLHMLREIFPLRLLLLSSLRKESM